MELGPLLQDHDNLKCEIEVVSKKKKKKKRNLPGAQTPYIGVWARSLSVGHGCVWRVEGHGSRAVGVEGVGEKVVVE